jgi:hypothetical protein
VKVSIIDDYFDTLRTLDCFGKAFGMNGAWIVEGRARP